MFHPSWKRCVHLEVEVVEVDIESIALGLRSSLDQLLEVVYVG